MSRRGFTLIEVLLSGAILALVLMGAYSAFFTGKTGYSEIERKAGRQQCVRMFLDRLAADLRNSFAFSPWDSRFSGSESEMDFFTLRDRFESSGRNRVVSRAGFRFAEGALRIRYLDGPLSLESEPASGYRLLAEGVKDCRFSYARLDEKGRSLEWKREWTDREALPAAVRIELEFTEDDGNYSRRIFLPR